MKILVEDNLEELEIIEDIAYDWTPIIISSDEKGLKIMIDEEQKDRVKIEYFTHDK